MVRVDSVGKEGWERAAAERVYAQVGRGLARGRDRLKACGQALHPFVASGLRLVWIGSASRSDPCTDDSVHEAHSSPQAPWRSHDEGPIRIRRRRKPPPCARRSRRAKLESGGILIHSCQARRPGRSAPPRLQQARRADATRAGSGRGRRPRSRRLQTGESRLSVIWVQSTSSY